MPAKIRYLMNVITEPPSPTGRHIRVPTKDHTFLDSDYSYPASNVHGRCIFQPSTSAVDWARRLDGLDKWTVRAGRGGWTDWTSGRSGLGAAAGGVGTVTVPALSSSDVRHSDYSQHSGQFLRTAGRPRRPNYTSVPPRRLSDSTVC